MAVCYSLLLKVLPETIALEQMYQICRISKRKAKSCFLSAGVLIKNRVEKSVGTGVIL